MTERLYQRDAYQKTFKGLVTQNNEEGVTLSETAFFPTGGGVWGDTGTLKTEGETWEVLETLERPEGIFHRLSRPGPPTGTEVTGELNWERRHMLMRYHTATHVLSGVMFQDYDVRVTGNQLTPEKARVDFSFPTFDRAILEEGFEKSNRLIQQNLPVEVSFIAADQAKERPELFKLETAFPHELAEIRLVDIVGFDVQADGGCHVASLSEIGQMVLTKTENKGKANRRVYFKLE